MKKDWPTILKLVLIFGLFLNAIHAQARGGSIRLLSSGGVFPTAADAVVLNPGALTQDRVSAYRAAGTRSQGGGRTDLTGTAVTATESFGIGATVGAAEQSGLSLGAATVAAGFGTRGFGMGFSVTSMIDTIGSASAYYDYSAGLLLGRTGKLQVGAKLRSITCACRELSVGIGNANPGRAQWELGLTRPLSGVAITAGNTLNAGVVFYGRSVGFGGYAAADLNASAGLGLSSYGLMGSLRLGRNLSMDAKMGGSSLFSTVQLGLMYAF